MSTTNQTSDDQAESESSNNSAPSVIQEYTVTSSRIDHITGFIWQTALLVVALVGAAWSQVANLDPSEARDWISIGLYAIASNSALWWWNAISDRWNYYINNMYERLREIERIVDFNSNLRIYDSMNAEEGILGLGIRQCRHILNKAVAFGWILVWLLMQIGGLPNDSSAADTTPTPPSFHPQLALLMVVTIPFFQKCFVNSISNNERRNLLVVLILFLIIGIVLGLANNTSLEGVISEVSWILVSAMGMIYIWLWIKTKLR